MTRIDIKTLLIASPSGSTDKIRQCLDDYKQLAFGVQVVQGTDEACAAAEDRDIEVAVLDAAGSGEEGLRTLADLAARHFPIPIVVVTAEDPGEFLELGAAECVPAAELEGILLPKTLVKLWVQTRGEASAADEGAAGAAPDARVLIEEQKEIVERFKRAEATFAALMPEGGRSYDQLSSEERIQLKLDLVEAYIDITKIYYARGDEESEELIRKFCDQLVALRYPPRELTSIHIGALELMLTEPGQPHRSGLISQNRIVFIDLLLNLLGGYHHLLQQAEKALSRPPE